MCIFETEIETETRKMVETESLADLWMNELDNDESSDQTENIQGIRRSERDHKQRIRITPDEIGDCDDENDEDYQGRI